MATVPSRSDTTYTKIFVGGLPYHTTDESLNEYFSTFGPIEEAVVITDRQTGKSRGYGFVTMADKEGAEKACKDPNPVIDGRKANVNLAFLGAKPRGVQTMYPHFNLAAAKPPVMFGQLGATQLFYPQTAAVMTQPSTAGLMMSPTPSQISPTAAAVAAAATSPYTTAAMDYNTAAAAAYLSAAQQYPAAAAAATAFDYPASAGAAAAAAAATSPYAAAMAAQSYPYGLQQSGLSLQQFPAAQQN